MTRRDYSEALRLMWEDTEIDEALRGIIPGESDRDYAVRARAIEAVRRIRDESVGTRDCLAPDYPREKKVQAGVVAACFGLAALIVALAAFGVL